MAGQALMPAARAALPAATLMAAGAFAATVVVSAALLFALQPMLGKALLPAFGGGAAVWTAVMLFFQIGLLAGSLMFHLLATRLSLSLAAAVHIAVAALGAALLPVLPTPQATGLGPAIDVLATLAVGYGPATLAMGGNAAALQTWYARAVGQPPWWLYAVSNAGSLAGLAIYPLLLEPSLSLSGQGVLWRSAFMACVVGLSACAWLAARAAAPAQVHIQAVASADWRRRAAWVGLAALPSSLLLGVTEHVTVSIAPLPLLWVLPLAVYLMSWIVAFAWPAAAASGGRLLAVVLLPLLLLEVMAPIISNPHPSLGVALHVAGLFAAGLLAHGQLALRRPDAAGLTGFYLHVSLGGALGGMLNALVAPVLLDRTIEYPLALAVLCIMPAVGRGRVPMVIWGAIGAMMAAAPFAAPLLGHSSIAHARDFYGAVHVSQEAERTVMFHGRTIHGLQWTDPARRLEPTSYYHREAGAGRLIAAMQALRGARGPMDAVFVGLGPGTLACYGSEKLRPVFVEISPAVISVARSSFSFLRECGDPPIEVGDGRIRVLARPPGSLDLVVIDAFSGSSVPAHMATVEAIGAFLARLAQGGAIAMHVSNGNFSLEPLIAAAARETGSIALMLTARPAGVPSIWVVVTRDAALAQRLADDGWQAPVPAARPWRDDRWDLLSAMRRSKE